MAAFAILFGTRHIDASERHEGIVAAIAFESVVKLFAFLAVGLFVTYGIYGGFGGVFSRAAVQSSFERLFTFEAVGGYSNWISLMLVSMIAIVVLPRQFQVLVVENVDEHHIKKAIWLFPLYLLLINLFVLPIALGGSSIFQENRRRRHVCAHRANGRAFPGAGAVRVHRRALCATGMIIVETIALATMVSNDFVMPSCCGSGACTCRTARISPASCSPSAGAPSSSSFCWGTPMSG